MNYVENYSDANVKYAGELQSTGINRPVVVEVFAAVIDYTNAFIIGIRN